MSQNALRLFFDFQKMLHLVCLAPGLVQGLGQSLKPHFGSQVPDASIQARNLATAV